MGKKGTGDWCLGNDTYLTLLELVNLLNDKSLKGKSVYIISDCSYSGAWLFPFTVDEIYISLFIGSVCSSKGKAKNGKFSDSIYKISIPISIMTDNKLKQHVKDTKSKGLYLCRF